MADQEEVRYPTAFLMIKEDDGSWRVTTDLTGSFTIDYLATRQDIRIGCQEIASTVNQQDLALMVASLLKENSQQDSQRVSASMRDAINRRKSE